MQINRMFEIIYLLLDKKKVTAKELAEHFEISVRTVYRDIENLCQSGIPIYTSKGRGGGICLLENFVLNKSVLTDNERQEIMWALQGAGEVKAVDGEKVLKRMRTFFGVEEENWIRVDFSGWNEKREETFLILKKAVMEKQVLEIVYYNTRGEKSVRQIEPLQLWFKDKTWYLKAFCRRAEEMRLFRISRMKHIRLLGELFQRETPQKEIELHHRNAYMISVSLHIDASCGYRIYDEFEEEDIHIQGDGSFLATLTCPHNDWVYSYLLSYGSKIKVLGPSSVKERYESEIKKMFYSLF